MKIIDLLNKIANGEEVPEKIKYMSFEWHYSNGTYYNTSEIELFDDYLMGTIIGSSNDEVEVIEDNKKIEKLKYTETIYNSSDKKVFTDKINEIIEVLNDKD